MLTITSREICEMLAGSTHPERLRPKAARLNAWHRAGLFGVVECAALNPGVGRGGVMVFPAEARAYATLFDQLADARVPAHEIAVLMAAGFRLTCDEAWLVWRMLGDQCDWHVITTLAEAPEDWTTGHFVRTPPPAE